ncbi:glycosyltransferase family 4 protein [Micromonospora sp. NPDC005173]|uniref:glycosyltransferase family 4 protein n=1 Tax=Micromonospora sp. NPDC005173 TaxID=3157165 RepID=UPI0033A76F01
MRVLYSFPTRLGASGVGTTAWHQVAGLAEHGAEVTVVCATNERALPPGVRVLETLRLAGVKIPFRVLGFMRAVTLHDRRTAAILRRMRQEIDVVHCWPIRSEQTLAAARQFGIRTVLERPNAHTAFAFDAVEQVCRELGIAVDPSSPHARRPEKLAYEEREYKLADRLLCPSDFVADTFRDAGVAPSRLLRHRYGFDLARFSPAGRVDADRPFTVGFVGRGEPRKGLHHALRAWLRSGAAEAGGRFLIAGAIEPGYRAVLAPLLAHESVEERGHVADPASLMRSCDVLVLPSVEEGSALVTYEARACGCVLVVSDRTGAVCENGVDGLVHSAGDIETLTAHLRSLAEDRERLERLRAASLRGAHDLTWSAAGRVLLNAYSKALSG